MQKNNVLSIASPSTTASKILMLDTPKIMGILNVTPDSFSDGGRFNQINAAVDHAASMISKGAQIIDIGGESTRPGAQEVAIEEELDRVIPVIEAIRARFDIWISVDTSKPEVITQSAKSGADLINDIRGLELAGAKEAAAKTNLPICIMHRQGEPKTMQDAPYYENVVNDVLDYFQRTIMTCEQAGIDKQRLILDPGFGFGKTPEHNYQLLAQLETFHQFGLPLLIGMSRKNMIAHALKTHNTQQEGSKLLEQPLPTPDKRIIGSVSAAIIAAMRGAHILRVHDVQETAEALAVFIEMQKHSAYL